jgi:hypothetical protein
LREGDAAVLAFRKGDLVPRSGTLPQLTSTDTSPLQWIGIDRRSSLAV